MKVQQNDAFVFVDFEDQSINQELFQGHMNHECD